MADSSYQRLPLSNSTNYTPINITATTPATAQIIHTSHQTNSDEVWLKAYNYSTSDSAIVLCLGGTATHQQLSTIIPAQSGEVPLLLGQTFSGSVVLSAFSTIANTIAIIGQVNRIIFI